MKPSEIRRFYDDFRGNKSSLICLNSPNITSKIWRRSFGIPDQHQVNHYVAELLQSKNNQVDQDIILDQIY